MCDNELGRESLGLVADVQDGAVPHPAARERRQHGGAVRRALRSLAPQEFLRVRTQIQRTLRQTYWRNQAWSAGSWSGTKSSGATGPPPIETHSGTLQRAPVGEPPPPPPPSRGSPPPHSSSTVRNRKKPGTVDKRIQAELAQGGHSGPWPTAPERPGCVCSTMEQSEASSSCIKCSKHLVRVPGRVPPRR